MNIKSQLLCCYSGFAFMILWTVGWFLFGNFIPPHQPDWSAAEVAAHYSHYLLRIRFGLLLSLWSTAFLMPFAAVLSSQLRRIEGRHPVWAYTVLGIGAGNVVTFTFPVMFWATAAFRPDRDPSLIMLLNDLGWVPFVGMTSPFLLLPVAVALVGFSDKSLTPTFPRWACFYNLGSSLLLLPGGLITFFHTGPFAWNGFVGFWLPVADFFIWFIVMFFLMRASILRDQAKRQARSRSAGVVR